MKLELVFSMEAPAPLKPPEITSPLKSEPQALIFQHFPPSSLSFSNFRVDLNS